MIDEEKKTEQGRRSNGQFFLPPNERTRFTIIHLPNTGDEPRSAETLPLPVVSPVPARKLERILVLGGGGTENCNRNAPFLWIFD